MNNVYEIQSIKLSMATTLKWPSCYKKKKNFKKINWQNCSSINRPFAKEVKITDQSYGDNDKKGY